jgi:hypothetical protein
MHEKGPFIIHLKVMRPDTPLEKEKGEKISFQSIRKYAWFICQREWK